MLDLLRGRMDKLVEQLDADPALFDRRFPELDFGSTAYRRMNLSGGTLMHLVAEYGIVNAARILLDRGADVNARAEIDDGVVSILEEMTSDWDLDLDGGIGSQTRLIEDLAFESIDVVQFVVELEQRFGRRGLPFEQLLMSDGRYVDDLTVIQVAAFLHTHLNG